MRRLIRLGRAFVENRVMWLLLLGLLLVGSGMVGGTLARILAGGQ